MSKEKLNPDFDKWLSENNPRKNMKVPDGYFNSFPDVIMEKINQENLPQLGGSDKPVKIFFLKKIAWGVAASLLILFAAITVMQLMNDSNKVEFANLEEDQAWEYIIAYSNDYEMEEFADFADLGETIYELESEFIGEQVTDEFLDNIDLELIKDIYEK